MDSINNIAKSIKGLVKNEIRFYAAKGIEKSSIVLGLIITIFLLAGLVFIAMVFLTIAVGNYLNEVFESTSAGYFIMAGFYLLLILLVFLIMLVRKAPMFTNIIIRSLVSVIDISEETNN